MSNPKQLTMTIEEAARVLRISRSLAYELARRGELPGVLRLGHRFIVSRSQLLKILDGDVNDNVQANRKGENQ